MPETSFKRSLAMLRKAMHSWISCCSTALLVGFHGRLEFDRLTLVVSSYERLEVSLGAELLHFILFGIVIMTPYGTESVQLFVLLNPATIGLLEKEEALFEPSGSPLDSKREQPPPVTVRLPVDDINP